MMIKRSIQDLGVMDGRVNIFFPDCYSRCETVTTINMIPRVVHNHQRNLCDFENDS
jgi:hypothetical protein